MEISKRIGEKYKMKLQKHYLNEKNFEKQCPLQNGNRCDSYCAWFDHEEQDCRMIGGFWKVREGLTDVTDLLTDIRDCMRGKDDEHKFKF